MQDTHDDDAVIRDFVENRMAFVVPAQTSFTDMVDWAAQIRLIRQEEETFFQGKQVGVGLGFSEMLVRINVNPAQVFVRQTGKPVYWTLRQGRRSGGPWRRR